MTSARPMTARAYVQGDLASMDDMVKVMEGAEMVVHMGAFVDEGPVRTTAGAELCRVVQCVGSRLQSRRAPCGLRVVYPCGWHVSKERIYRRGRAASP